MQGTPKARENCCRALQARTSWAGEAAVESSFLDGVAPAEVVHTGQGIGVAAHGHGVTDGFVHGVGHHPVGVVVAELGADTVGDDQTGIGFQQRTDDAGVGRTIVRFAAA